MTDFIDQAADVETTTAAPAPVVLTKEEKIARVVEQIKRLQEKLYNLENDIVPVKAAAKAVVLPEVGSTVVFTYGRRTATTEPTQKTGVVVAIKPVTTTEGGKTLPAQVKVLTGEGFDAEHVVIYPAQIIG